MGLPMKIAYLFDTYPRASETFLQREIDALQKRNFEIEIWALSAKSPAVQINIPPIFSASRFLYFNRTAYYNRVGRFWARNQWSEIDHIHSAWAGPTAQIAMAAAQEKNIPWSFSGHANDIWVRPHNLTAKLNSAAFATSCTHQGVEFLQNQIPTNPSKVLFAPHGLPLEEYPFTAHQQFFPPIRILAVGRLVEKKGFEYLLRALKLLQDNNLEVESTIVGDGPLRRKLEELTSELQLTHLHFEGGLPPHKVRAHMQRSSLLAAPCVIGKDGDHDGLPNVLLEAAALGLPILTTPVGGTGDLINEKTGWLSRPNNAADLAKTMQQIFANPQEAFARAQVARKAVEAHYNVMDNVGILADAFSRVMTRGG
jgi:glycosyltransferase involved in cell wall biosynthesis